MQERSSIQWNDQDELTAVAAGSTGGDLSAPGALPPDVAEPAPDGRGDKNPAAVALGRLGGLKGGKARAVALSAEQRRDIARKAAQARWARADDTEEAGH
jgi:hypothetical protein